MSRSIVCLSQRCIGRQAVRSLSHRVSGVAVTSTLVPQAVSAVASLLSSAVVHFRAVSAVAALPAAYPASSQELCGPAALRAVAGRQLVVCSLQPHRQQQPAALRGGLSHAWAQEGPARPSWPHSSLVSSGHGAISSAASVHARASHTQLLLLCCAAAPCLSSIPRPTACVCITLTHCGLLRDRPRPSC